MKQKIRIECEPVRLEPVMVTVDGVTFPLNDKLTLFYKFAEYADMVDAFLKEMKPYYWKEYRAAVRLKEIEAERQRKIQEQVAEQKRAIDKEKARLRRLRNKNGISTPENAVTNPVKGS